MSTIDNTDLMYSATVDDIHTDVLDNTTITTTMRMVAKTSSNQIMSNFLNDLYVNLRLILPSVSIVLNSLSILVFMQRRSRKASVSVFLIALAVADIMSNTATFYKEYIARLGGVGTSDIGCKITAYLTSVGKMCAVWLNLFYTLERFISVKYVFKRSDIVTPFRAKMAVLLLAVIMFIEEIYTLVWYKKKRSYYCNYKLMEIQTSILFGVLFKNRILNFLIPFVAVAIMNGCIVYQVRKAAIFQNKKSSSKDLSEGRITIMLVSLSATSFMLQLPSIIAETMMTFHLSVYYSWLIAFYLISKMLSHIDHSTNFFFYIIAGTEFRRDFIDMFTCARVNSKQANGVSSTGGNGKKWNSFMSKTASTATMNSMSKTVSTLSVAPDEIA